MSTMLPSSADLLRIQSGVCSVKGTRRERNEDSCYVSADADLFVVADGVGGCEAGEAASELVVDSLSRLLGGLTGDDDDVVNRIVQALDYTNRAVVRLGSNWSSFRCASTVAFLACRGRRAFVKGVGDSRVYLLRNGQLGQLTVDQTWAQMLVEIGQITAEEAKTNPKRHVLLEVLGDPSFRAGEDVEVLNLWPEDRFLLCSDGLTKSLDDDDLFTILSAPLDDAQWAAQALVDAAVKNGASDDVTCVTVFCESATPWEE